MTTQSTLPQNTGTAAPTAPSPVIQPSPVIAAGTPAPAAPVQSAPAAPASAPMLDPAALTLTKAIAYQENGGKNPDYAAQGKSGEYGAYQFTSPTWQSYATQVLGKGAPALQAATPDQQNQVAYTKVKQWLDAGYSPAQVASMWNAGEGAPNAYLGNKGTNNSGVQYDTKAYAQGVQKYAEQLYAGQTPTAPTSPSLGGFVENAVQSGANLVGNIGNAALHPIQTVETLGSIPVGGLQELGGQSNGNTQTFDNFVNYFKNRYGSADALGNTIYKDPVGFLADLSAAFSGAGALATGAGKIGEIAGIEGAADAAGTASKLAGTAADLTNPISPLIAGGKALAGVSAGGGALAAQGANLLTGGGTDAATALYEAAAQGGDAAAAAKAALRGEINPNAIVQEAVNGLEAIATKQSSDYQAALSGIKDISSTESIAPVLKSLEAQLKGFGIKVGEDKSLDFSRSTISSASDQSKITEAYNTINSWGLTAGDRTPLGLDTLKRRLDNLFNAKVDGKPVYAFLTPLRQSVRKVLSNVPGYDAMTKNFSQTQDLLDELKGTFAIGGAAKDDTIFKKLIGALRQNDALKTEMLKTLSDAGGANLQAKVAGISYSPYFARNLVGKGLEAGGIYSVFKGILSPSYIGGALATSPRLMGEFIMALGGSKLEASKFSDALAALKKAIPVAAVANATQNPLQNGNADAAASQP